MSVMYKLYYKTNIQINFVCMYKELCHFIFSLCNY